jgi:hypothetical protein
MRSKSERERKNHLVVVLGLTASGKSTFVEKASLAGNYSVIPEKEQYHRLFKLPCLGTKRDSFSIASQQYHIWLDHLRNYYAQQCLQKNMSVIYISDFLATLAYHYAVARLQGDFTLYAHALQQYSTLYRSRKIILPNCYLFLDVEDLVRERWMTKDSMNKERSDFFFRPAIADSFRYFYQTVHLACESLSTGRFISCKNNEDILAESIYAQIAPDLWESNEQQDAQFDMIILSLTELGNEG